VTGIIPPLHCVAPWRQNKFGRWLILLLHCRIAHL
jgi:hypothetical protein